MKIPIHLRTTLASAFACLLTTPLVVLAASSGSGSSSAIATKNYIDTISGYDELSTCAENVLSTIVRAQSSGCGDGGALTSYTCFCTDSSSLFSTLITWAISESCSSPIWSAQASSAISVFDAYCALGVSAGLATTTAASTARATGSPSPAATASTTAATATLTPVLATSAASTSNSRTVAIAAGVAVPCGVIALALVGCLLWRRRRRNLKARLEKQEQLESTAGVTDTGSGIGRSSMLDAGELPTPFHYAREMPGKDITGPPNSSSVHMLPTQTYPPQQYQNQQWTPINSGGERHELPASS